MFLKYVVLILYCVFWFKDKFGDLIEGYFKWF